VFHYINQSVTKAASSIQYAASFYVKNKGRQVIVGLQASGGSNGIAGRVDPATGAVVTAAIAFGTGWTVGTLTMTDAGNGWYRVVMTGTSDTTTSVVLQLALHNGTTNVYTGDGVSGIYLYGAQIEAGAFATSYIPTVAATVTRSADIATMTGTNFSSWYNPAEGSVAVSAASTRPSTSSPATRIFSFNDGTSNNEIRTGNTTTLQVLDAAIVQANLAPTPLIPYDGTAFTFASAWSANNFASVTTGAVATDTTGTIPTVTQLLLGSGPSAIGVLGGHIRSIAYYNTRLPNATLQALTA